MTLTATNDITYFYFIKYL